MSNETKKAIVKATNEEVVVYLLKRGTWCNFKDCTTEYKESELMFL